MTFKKLTLCVLVAGVLSGCGVNATTVETTTAAEVKKEATTAVENTAVEVKEAIEAKAEEISVKTEKAVVEKLNTSESSVAKNVAMTTAKTGELLEAFKKAEVKADKPAKTQLIKANVGDAKQIDANQSLKLDTADGKYTVYTNKHWIVLVDNADNTQTVFRINSRLVEAENDKITRLQLRGNGLTNEEDSVVISTNGASTIVKAGEKIELSGLSVFNGDFDYQTALTNSYSQKVKNVKFAPKAKTVEIIKVEAVEMEKPVQHPMVGELNKIKPEHHRHLKHVKVKPVGGEPLNVELKGKVKTLGDKIDWEAKAKQDPNAKFVNLKAKGKAEVKETKEAVKNVVLKEGSAVAETKEAKTAQAVVEATKTIVNEAKEAAKEVVKEAVQEAK